MPQYLVVLDLETTGLNADTDHIIEIAATKIDRETGEEIGQFNHLIKPSIEVDEKTTFITGITNEMLVDAQPFSVYLEDLKEFVKDSCIAGHNISFDTGFLSKHDMVFSTYPEFDTCPWAQVLGKNLPSYSLEVIARTLGIEHSASHRAYSDVEANLQLYFWLNKQFCALPEEQKKQIEEWAFACGYVLPFSHQCDLFAGSNDSNEKIETVMPLSDTAEKELEIDILSGKQYSSVSEDVLLKSIANQYQSAQKRLLYVAPNWTAYDFFQDKESVCILRSPYSYINQKKLSIFLSDPSIWSEMEFFIALKIYMYIGIDDLDTQLLDVSSLPVFREEKRILKPLCCSGFSEKSPSMDILRKQLSQAKCIFTDAHTFAHHSIEGDFQIFLADFEGSFLQKTYQDECDQVGLKQLQDIWKEITTHPLVGEDPRFVSIDERLSFLSGMVQHYILAGKWEAGAYIQYFDMHQSDIHNDIIQLVESLKEEIVSLKEDILSTIHPEQDYRSLQLEFLLHTIEDQFVRFAEIILEYNAVLYDYLVVLFQDASVSIRRQPKDSYGHVSSIENICVSQDVLFLVYGEGNNISDKGYKRPLQQICPHAEYFPVEKRSSDLYMLRSATNYQYSSDMCDQYSVEYLIQHFQEKQNKTIVVSNSFRSLKQIEAIVRATGVDQIILPGHTPGSFGKLVQTFQSMESGIFFVTYDYWNKLHFALQGAAQSVFMHRLPMPNTHGTEFQYLAKNMGYEGIEAYFNVAVPLGYCAFEKFLSECRLPLVLGDQAHRKKYSALFTAGKDISVIAND